MRTGFDAKRAVQNNTGLGNYSRYIIDILSKFYPENDCVLFAPKKKENSRLQTILSRKNIFIVFAPWFYRLTASLWRTFGVKKDIVKNKIDVFHGLSNELPVGIRKTGIKSVVTIHDLIFLKYPQYYKPADRIIYRFKFRYACRNADKIIAASECTKRDIISFFHIPENKISVVYQGCHQAFGIEADDSRRKAVVEKYGLPPCFLLNVGSIENRKNLMLAVKALKHIPENIHIVAVGKSTPYQLQVENYAEKTGLKSRLHILNNVCFDDLPALYQLADVFVYPSQYEGFGIPVIEALTSGTPVIAATGSCLEEAGGTDSFYVNPDDDMDLAKKIMLLINDKALSQKTIDAGREYVKRFSDKNIADNIMRIYRSL
ncbi:MAG: glycosyltransferase family 4 protein [Prevotellaceae bacterium]|jgi:glycosyltransferase involved in cell wall biosynthesis|nr:glycosyltransferase family 4 protein [Prevotellaceae bacterium]